MKFCLAMFSMLLVSVPVFSGELSQQERDEIIEQAFVKTREDLKEQIADLTKVDLTPFGLVGPSYTDLNLDAETSRKLSWALVDAGAKAKTLNKNQSHIHVVDLDCSARFNQFTRKSYAGCTFFDLSGAKEVMTRSPPLVRVLRKAKLMRVISSGTEKGLFAAVHCQWSDGESERHYSCSVKMAD